MNRNICQEGQAYEYLLSKGYINRDKIGSPVDSIGRATAIAVAKTVARSGQPVEHITKQMQPLDDWT